MDYPDKFSPTPDITLTRCVCVLLPLKLSVDKSSRPCDLKKQIMVLLETTNNLELHSVDIEQVFTQTDKLPEGVNGRYFINPPSGD